MILFRSKLISLAILITKISSFVREYLDGLQPFLSRVAPITLPSVKATEAGPSQGSINVA